MRYFQSNGGMAAREVMVSRAVNAINSGPASAPMAGAYVCQPLDIKNFITSTDEVDFDSSTVEDDPQHFSKVLIILDDQYRGH